MLNIQENGNLSVFHPVGGDGGEFTRTRKVPAGKALFTSDECRSLIEIPNASLNDLMDWQRGIKLVSQVWP